MHTSKCAQGFTFPTPFCSVLCFSHLTLHPGDGKIPAHELLHSGYCCPITGCHCGLYYNLSSTPYGWICRLFLIFWANYFNSICLSFLIREEKNRAWHKNCSIHANCKGWRFGSLFSSPISFSFLFFTNTLRLVACCSLFLSMLFPLPFLSYPFPCPWVAQLCGSIALSFSPKSKKRKHAKQIPVK